MRYFSFEISTVKYILENVKKFDWKATGSSLTTINPVVLSPKKSSRPSSSEWIERKIKVKQSSSEYSDSERELPTRQVKRKPNLAWVGLTQNDSTEEADL